MAEQVQVRVFISSPSDMLREREIAKVLSQRFGGSVQVTLREDPSIIGGLVVRIGDRILDDSLRAHLRQLQAALA